MPASPIHHTPIDADDPWDGPAAAKAFDKKAGDFVKFYAWVDEGETDADADGSDKEDGWGPHHDINSDGVPGDANLKGVEAAMAALNGAHGTTSRIPDADRQGVWDHLAAHYEDAGVKKEDIPELKSALDVRAELRRNPPASREERRDAALSFGDIEGLVYQGLEDLFRAKYPDGTPVSSWFDLWVCDLGPDWVVFQCWEAFPGQGMWKLSYTLGDDGAVTFTGDPVQVVEQSSYVPVPAASVTASAGEMVSADDVRAAGGLPGLSRGDAQTPLAKTQARKKKPRHRSGLQLGREYRRFSAVPEVRSVVDANGNEQIVITGKPIMYDTPYSVWDMYGEFTETIHAGAVTGVLASATLDCRFLFNHAGLPLARLGGPAASTTLTLTDSEGWLACEARLDARQQLANDLAVAIDRKDVSQMSIGMIVSPNGDAWSDDWCTRDIWELEDLMDVSAVTYPASPSTSIEVAQRMMLAMPVESRARVRRMWAVARDLTRTVTEVREGKVLSGANKDTLTGGLTSLQSALALLHGSDDNDLPGIVEMLEDIDAALDAGQSAISQVLQVADPDGDPADLEPTLTEPTEDNSAADDAATEVPDGSDGGSQDGGPSTDDGAGSRSQTDPLAELRAQKARDDLEAERIRMLRERREIDETRRRLLGEAA